MYAFSGIHHFQLITRCILCTVCVNIMRMLKRVLETSMADGETEVVPEGTTPAAVAVPVVLVVIVITVIIGVISVIVRRRRRRNRSKTKRYSTRHS